MQAFCISGIKPDIRIQSSLRTIVSLREDQLPHTSTSPALVDLNTHELRLLTKPVDASNTALAVHAHADTTRFEPLSNLLLVAAQSLPLFGGDRCPERRVHSVEDVEDGDGVRV